MRGLVCSALIVLAAAVPAAAWDVPRPIPAAGTGNLAADVAPDGTLATLSLADGGVVTARDGDGPPVQIASDPAAFGLVAALPAGGAIAVAGGDGTTRATVASASKTFGPVQDLGAYTPTLLRVNRRGDAMVLLHAAAGFAVTFRPAGGEWDAPVALPGMGGFLVPAVLTDSREMVTALRPADGSAGFDVLTLRPEINTPGVQHFDDGGNVATLSADAQGRILAAWQTSAGTLATAVRGADGTWGAPLESSFAETGGDLQAVADPDGDGLVSWSDFALHGAPAPAHVAPVSLADGVLGAKTDLPAGGYAVAERADGSAIVAFKGVAQPVRAIRRTATGPFSAPETVACSGALDGAWYPDAAAAEILLATGLTHDVGGARTCPPSVVHARIVGGRALLRHGLRVRLHPEGAYAVQLRARGRVLAARRVDYQSEFTVRLNAAGRRFTRSHQRFTAHLVLHGADGAVTSGRVRVR